MTWETCPGSHRLIRRKPEPDGVATCPACNVRIIVRSRDATIASHMRLTDRREMRDKEPVNAPHWAHGS
jgi:hypothetical protein